MKVGTFGGPIEALRREVRAIEQEERQRGNRRAFLGCLGGLAAGAAGLLGIQGAVKAAQPDAKSEADNGSENQGKAEASAKQKPLDRMEQLATGPLRELLAERWAFLHRVEQGNHSQPMVIGLSRLVHVAIEQTPPYGDLISRYVLGWKTAHLPDGFGPLVQTLRSSRPKASGK